MNPSLRHLGLVASCAIATTVTACRKEESSKLAPPSPSTAQPPESAASVASSARVPGAAPREAAAASVETFDDAPPRSLPDGWRSAVGQWRIERSESGQVLAQKAENESPVYNVVLLETDRHADVDTSVRLRARDGRIDQGGGLVWRAKDARNYYVARYNPLEDNFRLYHVVNGRRSQLESADLSVSHDTWHTIRITMRGEHIECFLDGKKYLDARDTTFTEAGFVGLWTKADARTEFDDFDVRALSGSIDPASIASAVSKPAGSEPSGTHRTR